MKGIVFTEFLEMVEETFSEELADKIIEESTLASDGAYTSLGTYDYHEMLELVTHLSQETGIAAPDLVKAFGQHLFTRFVASFPAMFVDCPNTFALLKRIDDYIHVEVRKLYPDAQLPRFSYDDSVENQLVLEYSSERPFAMLADGLISQSVEHFEEDIDVRMQDLSDGAGTAARFTLVRNT